MVINIKALISYKNECKWVDKTCKEMLATGAMGCNKYKCITCNPYMNFDEYYRECYLDDNRRNYARYDINYERIDSLYLDHIYKGIRKKTN